MDNFTDKLASKFNAQEMIKANAQAEANEMNRLKEQVAAYEAILTDMRKLNYKNSELTDKINALVDESITKFQSSRSEDVAVESSDISAGLSEAIMGALDEALNASVNNTLMIPVDEMKQSSLEVSGSVASVRQMVDDVKASADEIKGASDDVRNSASEVNATASELKATIEELKSSVSGAAFSTEDMKVSAQEIRSTTDALKNSNDELKTQVKNTVDNALLTMRRENREIADHLEYIRSTVENIHNPSEDDLVRKMEEEAKRAEEERIKEEERLQRAEEDKAAIQEMFRASDDFTHKENVKVYRNVQAVVEEQIKEQTDNLMKHNSVLYDKLKATRVAIVIAIILTLVNIALTALSVFGIIG